MRVCPPGAHAKPARPSISATRATRAPPDSAAATSAAPSVSGSAPIRNAAASGRSTTLGSSNDNKPSKSPPRAAARNASTTSRSTHEIDVGHAGRALHAAPGSTRELARRIGRPADDVGDLVEWHREHVVQHERNPLGGCKQVEHDEQRGPDGVSRERLLLGVVDPIRPLVVGWLRTGGVLPP